MMVIIPHASHTQTNTRVLYTISNKRYHFSASYPVNVIQLYKTHKNRAAQINTMVMAALI